MSHYSGMNAYLETLKKVIKNKEYISEVGVALNERFLALDVEAGEDQGCFVGYLSDTQENGGYSIGGNYFINRVIAKPINVENYTYVQNLKLNNGFYYDETDKSIKINTIDDFNATDPTLAASCLATKNLYEMYRSIVITPGSNTQIITAINGINFAGYIESDGNLQVFANNTYIDTRNGKQYLILADGPFDTTEKVLYSILDAPMKIATSNTVGVVKAGFGTSIGPNGEMNLANNTVVTSVTNYDTVTTGILFNTTVPSNNNARTVLHLKGYGLNKVDLSFKVNSDLEGNLSVNNPTKGFTGGYGVGDIKFFSYNGTIHLWISPAKINVAHLYITVQSSQALTSLPTTSDSAIPAEATSITEVNLINAIFEDSLATTSKAGIIIPKVGHGTGSYYNTTTGELFIPLEFAQYSDVGQLGLTAPVTTQQLFDAMPTGSMFCQSVSTSHVSDIPFIGICILIKGEGARHYGTLMANNSFAMANLNDRVFAGWKTISTKEQMDAAYFNKTTGGTISGTTLINGNFQIQNGAPILELIETDTGKRVLLVLDGGQGGRFQRDSAGGAEIFTWDASTATFNGTATSAKWG